jgi:hypothetical protein
MPVPFNRMIRPNAESPISLEMGLSCLTMLT